MGRPAGAKDKHKRSKEGTMQGSRIRSCQWGPVGLLWAPYRTWGVWHYRAGWRGRSGFSLGLGRLIITLGAHG